MSTTVPYPGQTITVSGAQFAARVSLSIDIVETGDVLGHAVTGVDGTFSVQVVIPTTISGHYNIEAVGGATVACPVDPGADLTVTPASAANSDPSSAGGLAFTGADVLGLLAIAVVLVGLGITLSGAGRRRRRHAR